MNASDELLESLRLMHLRLERLENDKRTQGNESDMSLQSVPRWLMQHHEWEALKQEFLTTRPVLGARFRYSTETLKRMNAQYNQYWKDITGRNIKFRFGEGDVKFMTVTEPALRRNLMLRKYFVDDPVVMEPFAGCGGDTITFMYNLGAKTIYASAMAEKFAVNYIQGNVNNFQEAVPESGYTKVVLFKKSAAALFHELTEEIDEDGNIQAVHIDLLYLDPPWTLPGMKEEATPAELLQFLNEQVFDPMLERGFTPKVIVVKTRFGWKDMRDLMSHIQGYLHVDTIKFTPFKNEVNFHVLIVNRYTISTWEPSQEYKHIYKGGDAPALPPAGETRAIDFGELKYERSGRQ